MELKFHSSTNICRHLVTASDDGLIRLHPFNSSGEIVDNSGVNIEGTYPVHCVDSNGDFVVVGTDEGEVILYHVSGEPLLQPLMRATLPIRSVQFSPDGKYLTVVSDDRSFKCFQIPGGQEVLAIKDVEKSVKSCCFNGDGSSIAAASCDGNLMIFSSKTGQSSGFKVKMYPHLEPEISLLSISWSPALNLIAVPGKTAMQFVNPSTPNQIREESGHKAVTTIARWSPNGMYVASYGEDETVIVWDCIKWEIVSKLADVSSVTDLKWHPKFNSIALSNTKGQFVIWNNPVPVSRPGPCDAIADSMKQATASESSKKKSEFISTEADVDNDDEGDDVSMKSMTDDRESTRDADLYDDLDDFIDDVDGNFREERRREYIEKSKSGHSLAVTNAPKLPNIHSYVHPNATSLRGNRRYLAFNLTGTIETIDQGTHHAVSIAFHDISSYRPINFKDHFGFNLSVLGERSALFASQAVKDAQGKIATNSTLYYRPFEAWAGSSDWTFYMPEDEEIVGIALSLNWAAAATSCGYIRLFSSSGVPLTIVCMPAGPIVSMTAFDNTLMVVFNSSSLPGARLEYQFINVDNLASSMPPAPLPISKSSKLLWAGFSDSGIPVVCDSVGVLRSCVNCSANIWIPVLDTRPHRKGKQEFYWPVGTSEDTFFFVLCKAGEKEPGFPKPIISDMSMAVPVLNQDTPIGKLEQQLVMQQLKLQFLESASVDQDEDSQEEIISLKTQIDKLLLQLIAQASKAEKSMRALDLCSRLNLEKSIQLAYVLANKHHLVQLGERIELVRRAKFSVRKPPVVVNNQRSQQPIASQFRQEIAEPAAYDEHMFQHAPAVEQQPDILFTPAKPPADNMFSSPNITMQVEDEKRPAPANPFRKKVTVASTSSALLASYNTDQPGKRGNNNTALALDNQQKKRKTVQVSMSRFVKPLAPERPDAESPVPPVEITDELTAEKENIISSSYQLSEEPMTKNIVNDVLQKRENVDEEESMDLVVAQPAAEEAEDDAVMAS